LQGEHVDGGSRFLRVVRALGVGGVEQAEVVEVGFFGAVEMFGPFVGAEDGGDFGASFWEATGETVVLGSRGIRCVMIVFSFFGNSGEGT